MPKRSSWFQGCFFAGALLVAGAGAQETESGKVDDKIAEKTKGLQMAMGKLMPEGRPSLGVTIPSFTEGVLSTLVKAASITRVGDQHLEMVAMVIQTFDSAGNPDLSINMETAQYDLTTGVLESDRPTQVSNSQFRLTGESLVYDTREQQGKLLGNVTMYVYNLGDFEWGGKKGE